MGYRELITDLHYLANELDIKGMPKEASAVDNIIKGVFMVMNKEAEEHLKTIK